MNVVDGIDSYFLTTLSGIPVGEDISDGTYPGWCVDTSTPIPRDTDLNVTLYSSLEPPEFLEEEAWDMVNYILNHKQGGRIDIQAAIWYFIKLDPLYTTPGYYTYNPGGNPYGGMVDNRCHSSLCDCVASDGSLSTIGNFKGQSHRSHLYQQHDFSVHGRVYDRFNHGKMAITPANSTFYHPSHRWRSFQDCTWIHGGGVIFIHVDFQYCHSHYDGTHRIGHCFATGSKIR